MNMEKDNREEESNPRYYLPSRPRAQALLRGGSTVGGTIQDILGVTG